MSSKSELVVRSFPRLHVALMDLGNASPRRFGGAGFGIAGPVIEVRAERVGRGIEFIGTEKVDSRARTDMAHLAERLNSYMPRSGVRIWLEKMIPQHVGLGSKTALLLALATAALESARVVVTRTSLQELSCRGGVSGVGINSFFDGGFVVDAGHPRTDGAPFLPSNATTPQTLPLMILNAPIPEDWMFHLILPVTTATSSETESELFRLQTPIPAEEVRLSITWLYHGVVPAVLTRNVVLLGEALRGLHSTGFKRRELEAQHPQTRAVYEELSANHEWGVGLSSVGPLIYVVTADAAAQRTVAETCTRTGCTYVGTYLGRTGGYEVLR